MENTFLQALAFVAIISNVIVIICVFILYRHRTAKLRIILGDKEFFDLVRGKPISDENSIIILKDIGYDRMLHIVKYHMGDPKLYEK